MRATIAILIILGLVAAISASVLVATMRAQEPARLEAQQPEPVRINIVRAARDLQFGEEITADMIEMKEVLREEAPADVVIGEGNAIGRTLGRRVAAGAHVRKRDLAREGSGPELANQLVPGKRAMAVTIADAAALEGVLYPGARVDVIASFQASDEEQELLGGREILSTVLLENIKVLGADEQTIVTVETDEEGQETRRAARRRQVTLEVDGKQAEVLQLASAHGNISLALRNPEDPTVMESEFEREPLVGRGVLFHDLSWEFSDRLPHLLAAREAAAEAAAQQRAVEERAVAARPAATGRPQRGAEPAETPTRTIEVIRGSNRSSHEVEIKPPPKETETPEPRQTAGTS